jgi:hypothetical protein
MIRHATLSEPKVSNYNISRENVLGKRVGFKSTTDSSSKLTFNDLGTVSGVFEPPECVRRQNTMLWIRWDTGCLHPLINGVDSFDIFEEAGI